MASATETERHVDTAQIGLRANAARARRGPVVMLNLLRFRDIADYSESPELAPESPISGVEAYQRYIAQGKQIMEEIGGETLFLGDGGTFLIGPEEDRWDKVLLVRWRDVEMFVTTSTDKRYLAIVGHRTAALEDSRLLAVSELPIPT